MAKVIMTIITILWMILIFLFSCSPAEESNKQSGEFIRNTIVKIVKVFKKDLDEEKFIERIGTPIRKCAHFAEFLVLGMLMYFTLKLYGVNNPWIVILACSLYAVTDEIHQLFVKERTAKIIDVIIDTIGSGTGIAISMLITKLLK